MFQIIINFTCHQLFALNKVMRDRWEMLKKQKMEALEAKASLAVAPPKVPRPTVPTPYSSTNAPSATLPSSGTGKVLLWLCVLTHPTPQLYMLYLVVFPFVYHRKEKDCWCPKCSYAPQTSLFI